MCDGRAFASSPCRRLAGRAPSFCGFPVWWIMQLAIYLARSLTLQTLCLILQKVLNTSAVASMTL